MREIGRKFFVFLGKSLDLLKHVYVRFEPHIVHLLEITRTTELLQHVRLTSTLMLWIILTLTRMVGI